MDLLLRSLTSQAMSYALRTGITFTTTYAFAQCNRLLHEAPKGKEHEELMLLQMRLQSKIRIIAPAIDMIELISARGHTSLDSALALTKEIRYEIQMLGTCLNKAVDKEVARKTGRRKPHEQDDPDLRSVIARVKALLIKIEDSVPLINLAITTSGVSLSTKLAGTISPSRLLQASTFLTAADTTYVSQPGVPQQVGPSYTVTLYMLFAGHAWRPVDEAGVRATTWKEVMHKAQLKLMRVPLSRLHSRTDPLADQGDPSTAEFAYQLVLTEDLDDDRYHEPEEMRCGPFGDVAKAGLREVIPIHETSKIFYADTGKILNIGSDGDSNTPVLLLRRDINAEPPRRMLRRSQVDGYHSFFDDENEESEIDTQIHREFRASSIQPDSSQQSQQPGFGLPSGLDPEWMAFEVFTGDTGSEDEDDEDQPDEETKAPSKGRVSLDFNLTSALSSMRLRSPTPKSTTGPITPSRVQNPSSPAKPCDTIIKTSLSLLEMLLKLTSLQQFRQESHLAIEDEVLNFFLEESSTAGSGPDKEYRQRLRHQAVQRVGFDPYDESPIKRRNVDYIQRPQALRSNLSTYSPLQYDAVDSFAEDGLEAGTVHESIEHSELATSPSLRPHLMASRQSRSVTPSPAKTEPIPPSVSQRATNGIKSFPLRETTTEAALESPGYPKKQSERAESPSAQAFI